MTITTTDNNSGKSLASLSKEITQNDYKNLLSIANKSIKSLNETNSNFLIFPQSINTHKDKIEENEIFTLSSDKSNSKNFENSILKTNNIMGFVGITDGTTDTELDIKSRFAKDCDEDYFLHYMLQKVFRINLFKLKHSSSSEKIFDFLIYLFPHFLKKALSQGLYKKYRTFNYNDANVRGTINISRQIKSNTPFNGKIAYSTRLHSYDNEVTELIRHTIEYIKTKENAKYILNTDEEIKTCVSQIMSATKSFNMRDKEKIISQNIKIINHPYYSNYAILQKLCLAILHHYSIKFGKEKNKVYGILFDGAWLWEEYLATFLTKLGFLHPQNKVTSGSFKMFENPHDNDLFDKNSRRLYPDFYKEDFILDAKYKNLENGVGREDLYQVVTYMYCKKASVGGFLYPTKEKSVIPQTYALTGYGGIMKIIPFYVEENCSDWKSFCKTIEDEEKKLINFLQ